MSLLCIYCVVSPLYFFEWKQKTWPSFNNLRIAIVLLLPSFKVQSLWYMLFLFWCKTCSVVLSSKGMCEQSEMKIMEQKEKVHSQCDCIFITACSHFSYLFQREASTAIPFFSIAHAFKSSTEVQLNSAWIPFSCVQSDLLTCCNVSEHPLYCNWNQGVCFLCSLKTKTALPKFNWPFFIFVS